MLSAVPSTNPEDDRGRMRQGRIIVTGGPALAPVDAMRILTNRSTGELSIRIANALADAGFSVDAWIGCGATFMGPRDERVCWQGFQTNADVLSLFESAAKSTPPVLAIFHAAALSDFEVLHVEDASGNTITAPKIPSSIHQPRLILEAAPKILPALRGMFPSSFLAGWKFEAGDAHSARVAALAQLQSCASDACILNGPALGSHFEWITPTGNKQQSIPAKPALVEAIVKCCEALV